MKKKLIIALIVFILLGSLGIIYLNKVILPTRIKQLIVKALKDQTQKNVKLESLRFNIFKGLVLTNLTISDDKERILAVKQASCLFLVFPIFKKTIVIPELNIDSAQIYLERRKDAGFNLQDLFSGKGPPQQEKGFKLVIYRLDLTNSLIKFKDLSVEPPLIKDIEKVNLRLIISLPAGVKFNLRSEIAGKKAVYIAASGEYRIAEQQLASRISVKNFYPDEFSAYYQKPNIAFNHGLVDAEINLKLKGNNLSMNIAASSKGLSISKDNISIVLNSDTEAQCQYDLGTKQAIFSGEMLIADSSVSGPEAIGSLNNISGKVFFDRNGLSSRNLTAAAFGLPLQAELTLKDFTKPILEAEVSSDSIDLSVIQGILKDKFNLIIPGNISGKGNLFLSVQGEVLSGATPAVQGYLDIIEAMIKPEKSAYPIKDINGKVEFSTNQLNWAKLNFTYLDQAFNTSGTLTNFRSPGVRFDLVSKNLSLESIFALNGKIIRLSKLSGRYFDSGFSMTGDVDISDLSDIKADMEGKFQLSLNKLKEALPKFSRQLGQINPKGTVDVRFDMDGSVNDFKSCNIDAALSSSSISVYGLTINACAANYKQKGGIVDIPLVALSLYGGNIQAQAGANLRPGLLPYWLNINIRDLSIEKLKLDTPAKYKDIAGIIQGEVKINGFSGDLGKLSGAGKIFISEGKLWQLNLFQGIGSLLFARDFANIIFDQGNCAFLIKDRYIFTDNLVLRSNIADLSGPVKIGFDKSIDASLNVHVLDEMTPPSGTFKDITTAIIGQGGRFGTIKISGTIDNPKHKFQAAVVSILKGLKDTLLGQ